jgi:glyoxylase-like metal-dependent hydrolase (beta-lactamase superfamily II)
MVSAIVRRLVVALALAAFPPVGTIAAEGVLEIYFIDTEGGQATLLVSPTGGTLLIDTGFAGLDTANPDKESGRDAARIAEVAKSAGVKQIDVLLATHFHGDHASGVTHLVAALPVSGGPVPLKAFRGSPGIEDLWQLHKNVPGGADGNPPDEFSANLQDTDDTNHAAHYLKLSARDDGSFSVFNSRTKVTKAYGARHTMEAR